MKITVKYEEGKIYAYTVKQNGQPGSHSAEVTDEVHMAFLQYVVDIMTSGDGKESFETERPIMKYGSKPYKVEITVTPQSETK